VSCDSFDCDAEFLKLMSRREDVDLTIAALEIARDAQPGLDFSPTLDWIEARGRELIGPLATAATERGLLEELGASIAETHGVFGTRERYDRPDSSYLNRVVETGRGLPISLSVLYMAVAERAGVQLDGVAAPLHFLVRYESTEGPLFVDPYHRGRVLERDECIAWLSSMSGLVNGCVERALEPVGSRTILVRMLNNLKSLHVRNEDWRAAWNVQTRLTALQPSSYHERRDLAQIALRAGRPGHAIELFECCLKSCPPKDVAVLREELATARGRLALWN
jgi:regulator of sirC expression with transglutaminase-like and TPR domain